ncbi:SDR family NAD(P)-dependent oxidoreductase [Elizabethkingia ursingii]|uniref:SDR family NAD(P)-dependent oxidoreductase n=1 Tax=Elizabethkingia ursingii TaxID=1756150 RepID=UPI0020119D7E|nr:SDR family NAD(P)-dependent oxidoreductase [Elizabethkingia ursingii]MCL1667023.1 SDR family NAD(P)-dependent oxidoreductase [Elizabethkingia ursingii]
MLNNKVAYITGGTKGIGLGIASVLLNAGMRVAISGRNLEDAKAAAMQLSSDSSKVLAIQSNVRNFEDEDKALQEVKNHFGQVDLVVANAGLGHFAPVDELSIASLAGTNFFANGSGYNASKFGVVGFTQAAMLDLRKYNVKVSTIMPGSVKSHFNNHNPGDNDEWKIQPEDIGELIVDMMKMNPRTLPSKIEIRPTLPK